MLLETNSRMSSLGALANCRICFIVGAPSAAEWNTRKPLSGRSSDLFVELCKTAGIKLSDCYYTYVIKHFEKSHSHTIKFGTTKVTTSPQYLAYETALKEELDLCSANVFVPLDDIALYALTREVSVSKWRGSILASTMLGGRKVIPTLPAQSAWANYNFRHFIVHDLNRVRKDSLSPDLDLPQANLIIKPSYQEAADFIKGAYNHQIIGFDIETSRGQLDCFSLAYDNKSICIPLLENMQPYFSLESEAAILWDLAELLASKKVIKVLQNGIYDATFLYERYGMRIFPAEDTMIMHGLMFPDFPKSLAFLASIYTRHPFYKDEGKERFKGFYTDDTRFWQYSARDSLVTLEVWYILEQYVHRMGLWDTYRSHLSIIPPLLEMQLIGYTMDKEKMKEAAEAIDAEVVSLRAELNELCGYEINPNSPKQLCEYFYGVKKLKPYLKKGSPTTDVTAMQRLAARGFPEAMLIVNLRRLRKFSSTYLKVPLDGNLLRCSYNPIGTNTGRLSSKSSIFNHGCNRQNLPKRGKLSLFPFILQRPNYIPYSIDLSGAENRIVAYYGPVPAMIEAFESGLDVHRLTASLLFNIPYETISDESGSANIMGSDKSQRDMGKMFNHSGNYGVGAPTLALKNDLPLNVVRDGLNQYHILYPEVKQSFQAQIVEQLRSNNRTVTNCLGRTRKFMDRWGDDMFQDAYAFPAQSTIADIINRRGLSFIYRNPKLREVHLINQIHDSIEFEISTHHPWLFHSKCIRLILNSLEQPLCWQDRTFSIPCDLEVRHGTFSTSAKIKKPNSDPWRFSLQLQHSYESLC